MIYRLLSKKTKILGYLVVLNLLFFQKLAAIEIIISNKKESFIVSLAQSDEEKKRGLMFVKNLEDINGMLFLYKKEKILKIWMKDTFLDLDVIFIDKNFKISSIKKGNKLTTDIIFSDRPVIAVLEIPSECNKKIKLQVGESLYWNKISKKDHSYYSKFRKEFFPCIKYK